ncbi:MAG TPA: hypothetical protein VJ821_09230 [Anaerolineales bacterium]|nr:hypothetical protein [Anaerolineales bacterium]
MFILITVVILITTTLALLFLRFFLPQFRYTWLVATGGGILAWISVLVWQTQIPMALQFSIWQPTSLFSQSPTFVADGIAWALALSLVTLCLGIIITSVVRSSFPGVASWMGTLVLTSLGVLATVADNPLTLVLIWSAIDLAELIIQMRFVEDPRLSERVVIAFASRATGTLILLWADMISVANGQSFDFRSAPSQTGLYLLTAAALRLGVLPFHLPYASESSSRRGFGTGLRMVSAASSLILLTRIPSSSLASPLTPYMLILVSFASFYAGWMWIRAPEELAARPFWLIGMGALAVAAALQANPVGAAAWGCALILAGGGLFLFSENHRWLSRALWVGVFGMSALPFSLTATGWAITGMNFWPAWPSLLFTQAMLMAGFVRHSQRTSTRVRNEDQPIWAKNVYPIGISLLLITMILLGLFGWSGTLQIGNWIAGSIATALALGLLWATPRLRILNPVRAHWVRPTGASGMDWGYQALWNLYRRLRRISNTLSSLLEGESGIMWTLLFLVLFISFFTQGTP